jgi:Lrp/AsnC family transcriptional regulator for asnA, asnC and gidA
VDTSDSAGEADEMNDDRRAMDGASETVNPSAMESMSATDDESGLDDDRGAIGTTSGGNLLDRANRAIIEALQKDGRRPYGAIAEEVGLSEAAVRRRVQRLRESGVIQIVAVTDPLQLGFTRQALVGITVEGDVRGVAAKLEALNEVDYVVMCAGSFDILAEVVCEDDGRLLHLLNDAVRAIPGVRSTETFLYLKLAKQTYTWGTR